jgi:hypothetical protein
MGRSGVMSLNAEQIEEVVLIEIIASHPEHLTSEELVVRLEDGPSNTDRVAILDSLQELKRSGLIRFNGEVVEPTHAALRAAEVFGLPCPSAEPGRGDGL